MFAKCSQACAGAQVEEGEWEEGGGGLIGAFLKVKP